MARGRVITPDFWTDGNMIGMSAFARLFYIGLWNFAYCDKGHLPDDALGLKLKILPADPVDADELLAEVMAKGRVVRLEAEGKTYLSMPSFAMWQKSDPRWKTRCPACAHQDSLKLTGVSESHAESHQSSALREEKRTRENQREEEKHSSSEVAIAPIRRDVDSLLDLLDTEITANGGRKPSRNKKNADAMRLLIDRDGCSTEQVANAIRWCQADEFWRGNILSASKLRDKYDQLRLAAQRTKPNSSSRPIAKADQNALEFQRLYGGVDNERTGSFQALDVGIGA